MNRKTAFVKQLFLIAGISILLFAGFYFFNYFMYVNYHVHLETSLPWTFFKQ